MSLSNYAGINCNQNKSQFSSCLQIEMIRKHAENMKQQIADYEEKRLNEISQFISHLSVKVEDLQHLQSSTNVFLGNSHPIEIIQTGEETRNRLQKTIDVKIQSKYASRREMQLYEQGTTLISIDNESLRIPLTWSNQSMAVSIVSL